MDDLDFNDVFDDDVDENVGERFVDVIDDKVEEEISNDFADAEYLPSYNAGDEEDEKPLSPTKRSRVGKENFELLKCIGSGSFGKVFQVQHKTTKIIYAMKIVPKELLIKRQYVKYMNTERNILTKVDHPFIVGLKYAFQSTSRVFLVMEFCHGGELFLLLRKEGLLLEESARFYAVELILALEHLHKLDIIHRDLKPENILLGADGHIKVTDFGVAKDDLKDSTKTICGTNEYIAPEMINGGKNGYGMAVDWWSFGTILFEMLTGSPPFKARDKNALFRKILSDKIVLPRWLSEDCSNLLLGLLERNAENRLGARKGDLVNPGGIAELKSCPFFKNINWNSYLAKTEEPPIKVIISDEFDTSNFDESFESLNPCRSFLGKSSKEDGMGIDEDLFRGFSYVADAVEPQFGGKKRLGKTTVEEKQSDADLLIIKEDVTKKDNSPKINNYLVSEPVVS